MMQIVYFSRKEQFLGEMEKIEGDITYVTPSPGKADGLRSRLLGTGAQDVVTIAKFTSQLVEALWDTHDRPMVKRKADLLLMFGILKNKYFPELGFEQFVQAYNLFSDLRSFTLNEEAMGPVMEEQPEDIKKAIGLFWRLLELTGFLDEHGAYHKITEYLRSSEEHESLKKTWVFWGFQHLNGQQVDLLKALAIRYEVVIPFPLALKERIKKTDWPTWLLDTWAKETKLPEEGNIPRGKWLLTNSRENSRQLRDLIRDGDQIILGVSKLSPLHLDLVPSLKVSYKVPHQLVDLELREIRDDLKERLKDLGMPLNLPTVLKELLVPGNFKRLKAIQLYEEALGTISELTDETVLADEFFLKLLHEVVSLNQPRTSYVPMLKQDLSIELKDMSSLEDVDQRRRVILCVDERFDDPLSLGQNYTESIQKTLAALGPLKRSEFELLFKQWEFNDLFSQSEVLVLMSEGALKHSLVWKRMFSAVELERVDFGRKLERRNIVDHFTAIPKTSFEGRFSASKFQSFLDCPRKFYFSYVDKVFPSVTLEKDFDPMASGTIIHRIIEVFHKRELSIEELPKLTVEIMGEVIGQQGLSLSRETYLQRQLIFNHRALNGIRFLEDLNQVMGEEISWEMEVDFDFTDEHQVTGKIDCIGSSSRHLFLLDFKSTKFSASSFKEVEDLESLQLWTYARAASYKKENFKDRSVVLGYVVLDRPSESVLLMDDEGLMSRLKEGKLCKQKVFKEGFNTLYKSANLKMSELALAIKSEKSFAAIPRKAGVCHFCELNKVCVKNGVGDV